MKEIKYIHRICPCHHYDIEGIQSWLEDMASHGWILEQSGYGLGLFTFEKSKPTRCRYRLEVIFESRKSYREREEYLELLQEYGWIHVTDYHGFEVFCTHDLTTRELSTDPVIQATTLKKLKQESIHRIIFMGIYAFIVLLNHRLNWFSPFRLTASFGLLAVLFMVAYLVLFFTIPIHDLWQIHNIEGKLKSGSLLNEPKEWKPYAPWHTFCKLFPTILGVAALCMWIGGLITATNQQAITAHIQDPPFITIQDLSDSDYSPSESPIGQYNYYVTWSNSIVPVNYEWREHATFTSNGEEETGILVLEYHETKSEWFAQGLADDYYIYQFHRLSGAVALNAPQYGLDQVRIIERHGIYDIVIRHDNIIIYACYSQLSDSTIPDWQIWLEAMAQLLLSRT